MKRIISIMLLLGAFSLTGSAQITIESPQAGDKLPTNGQIFFWWSNSVPLQVSEYLDRYDNLGILQQSIALEAKGYFFTGVDYYDSVMYGSTFIPGQYRLRLEGTTIGGQVYEAVSGFFEITPNAVMTCTATTTNDWLKGTSKEFTISWTHFQVGDPYEVIMVLSQDYMGEGYGFMLQSGTIPTEFGSMTFMSPFPTEARSLYPPAPSIPVDDVYQVMFINEHNFLKAQTDPFNLIMADIHVELFQLKDFAAPLGRECEPLAMTIDATYSPEEVTSLTIPIILAGTDTNTEFLCALVQDRHRISEYARIRITGKEGRAEITTHGFRLQAGEKASIELGCVPLQGSGLFQFGVDREFAIAAAGRHRDHLSVVPRGPWGLWGPVVTIADPVLDRR
jgi:hypothetical protein